MSDIEGVLLRKINIKENLKYQTLTWTDIDIPKNWPGLNVPRVTCVWYPSPQRGLHLQTALYDSNGYYPSRNKSSKHVGW